MKVSKEIARMLCSELDVGSSTAGWEPEWFIDAQPKVAVVFENMYDTSRWAHHIQRVYKDLDTGKYWSTTFRRGATECQEERPYENDGEEIEFTEVVPKEVIKIEYVAAQGN